MGRVPTNQTSLKVGIEPSLAADPTVWEDLQPNGLNTFGPTITTVARSPISISRQRQKGTVTDKESAVEWEGDLTLSHFMKFIEGFVMASAANSTVIRHLQSGASYDTLAATTDAYTHSALSGAIPAGTLVYARGFATAANNGLDEVDSGGTTTNTPMVAGGQVAETPSQESNAQLDVAGFRPTDLTWTDATTTIGSSATDLTTLGLTAGQLLGIGSDVNAFTNGRAMGRIVSIAANSIVLDKVENIGTATLKGGGDQTSSTVDLLYGRFIRNVPVTDSDFLERSFMFEAGFANLDTDGDTMYEYAKGNYANELTINLPLTDKATMTVAFLGTDTDAPTDTAKSGSSTAIDAVMTAAFNTSADILRLRIQQTDEDGLTTCFKEASITLRNNVSHEKCLGTLGATYINFGNFEVDLDSTVLFTVADIVTAINTNETVTMDFVLKNDDGGIGFDLPSLLLGDGAKEFPVNESIRMSVSGQAFEDATLGTSIGVSIFPYLP